MFLWVYSLPLLRFERIFCSFAALTLSSPCKPHHLYHFQTMNDNTQQPVNIEIELGEKEAEGIYSNLAIISHSPAEFVVDFTRILPGVPKAKVHARIVMTPQHAKLLLHALNDNIARYEAQYGVINVEGQLLPQGMMPIGGPNGGAQFH